MSWSQQTRGWSQAQAGGGGGGTTGAVWEIHAFDFTLMDAGSIKGGTTPVTSDLGGTLSLVATANPTYSTDISIDFGTGLTFQGVTGNFESTTPRVDLNPNDLFPTLDLTKDEVAVMVEADVSGLPVSHGLFIVCYQSSLPWANDHASVGVFNTSSPRTYYPRRRQGGGTTESGKVTGASKDFLTFHLSNGLVRACADTTKPSDPYAATTFKDLWPAANVDEYSTPSPFMTTANLRFSLAAMTESGGGTVTVRRMWIGRLPRASA